jgi:hypothetical protein
MTDDGNEQQKDQESKNVKEGKGGGGMGKGEGGWGDDPLGRPQTPLPGYLGWWVGEHVF